MTYIETVLLKGVKEWILARDRNRDYEVTDINRQV